MGDLANPIQSLARFEQSDGGELVYHSPRRRPGGLFFLWIALIALTVLSLCFKWWFVFVVFTLCGVMGLIGLYLVFLYIRAFWFPWRLVLDLHLRTGSFFWKTPFKSHTQRFSLDDVKSINVGSDGDEKG